MAEVKKASLTVLGGPLAGTRTLLPDDAEVTIGSSEECALCLEIPTVSPVHARLVMEGGQITVFGVGAERPLHVNDSPVGPQGTGLRNGDILWLGTPGEDDVVMLQCILPRRPAAPAPAEAAPPEAPGAAAPTPQIETTALWTGAPSEEAPPAPSGEEATAILPDEGPAAPPPAAEPGAAPADEPVFLAFGEEQQSREEDEAVVVEEPPTRPADEIAPVDLGDAGAVVVNDDELFAGAAPTLVTGAEVVETPDAEATVAADANAAIVPPEHETPAPPSPPPAAPATPPPHPPPAARPPSPPPAPARPAASRPPAPATPGPEASAPPGSTPRPARPRPPGAPARPASIPPPSASMARRRPGPRRELPREARAELAGATRASAGGRPVLVVVGAVVALLVAAGGWAVWRFVLARPKPAPTPIAAMTPRPRPPVTTLGAQPLPAAAPTLAPTEAPPAPVAAPTAAPTVAPAAAPTTPQPVTTPTATPLPTATPAPTPPPTPSADVQRARRTAARVQELLAQAQTAAAARQYDAAIGHLDEALRLDPGNAAAQAARATAVTRRDLAKRRFVAGRTRVQTAKADAGGLAGFDTGDADLRKAPDFTGRLEFEMDPPSGIEAGDAWTLRVYVVNGGKKPIRVQGVTVSTRVNGSGSGGPTPALAREIPPQQRDLVADVKGTWAPGTTAWSSEVSVTANKGDSLSATLTWR
jgi:hypothetical protein